MNSKRFGKPLVVTENGSILIPTDYYSAPSGSCSGPNNGYATDKIIIRIGSDPVDIDLRSWWLNIPIENVLVWSEIAYLVTSPPFFNIGTAPNDSVSVVQSLIVLHPTLQKRIAIRPPSCI
jgi:hypothetical protein